MTVLPAEILDRIASFVNDEAKHPGVLYKVGYQLSRQPSLPAMAFRADYLWRRWAPATDIFERKGPGVDERSHDGGLADAFDRRHQMRSQLQRRTLYALWNGKRFPAASTKYSWAFERFNNLVTRLNMQLDKRFEGMRRLAAANSHDADILHALGKVAPIAVCVLPDHFREELNLCAAAVEQDFRAFKTCGPTLQHRAPLVQFALDDVGRCLQERRPRCHQHRELALMWGAVSPTTQQNPALVAHYEMLSAITALDALVQLRRGAVAQASARRLQRFWSTLDRSLLPNIALGYRHLPFYRWAAHFVPVEAGFILAHAAPNITASGNSWLEVAWQFVAAYGENYRFLSDPVTRSHSGICCSAMRIAPHLFAFLPPSARTHGLVAETALMNNVLNWSLMPPAVQRSGRYATYGRAFAFIQTLHAQGLIRSLEPTDPQTAAWATSAGAAFMAQLSVSDGAMIST